MNQGNTQQIGEFKESNDDIKQETGNGAQKIARAFSELSVEVQDGQMDCQKDIELEAAKVEFMEQRPFSKAEWDTAAISEVGLASDDGILAVGGDMNDEYCAVTLDTEAACTIAVTGNGAAVRSRRRDILHSGKDDFLHEVENQEGTVRVKDGGSSGAILRMEYRHSGGAEERMEIYDVEQMRILARDEWTAGAMMGIRVWDPGIPLMLECRRRRRRTTCSDIVNEGLAVEAYWAQWWSLRLAKECLSSMAKGDDGGVERSGIVLQWSCRVDVLEESDERAGDGHLDSDGALAEMRRELHFFGCGRLSIDWCCKCDQCAAVERLERGRRGAELEFGIGVGSSSALCERGCVDRSSDQVKDVRRVVQDRMSLTGDKVKVQCEMQARDESCQEERMVWNLRPGHREDLGPKVQSHWEGACIIMERMNSVVCGNKQRRGEPKVVHLERMALYRGEILDAVRDEQV